MLNELYRSVDYRASRHDRFWGARTQGCGEARLLGQEYGLLCFDMEGAAALSDFLCLVIHYCNSHKNDQWHDFAAAAAYARQLFFYMLIDKLIGK
jgi:hypothetical protein